MKTIFYNLISGSCSFDFHFARIRCAIIYSDEQLSSRNTYKSLMTKRINHGQHSLITRRDSYPRLAATVSRKIMRRKTAHARARTLPAGSSLEQGRARDMFTIVNRVLRHRTKQICQSTTRYMICNVYKSKQTEFR